MKVEQMSPELSAFLSVLLGSSMFCCVTTNIWIGVKRYRHTSPAYHFSPYFLSSCLADVLLTCTAGPTICVVISSETSNYHKVTCIALDVIFLSLFLGCVLSQLIYNLDRHCLFAVRTMYKRSFGELRRNAVTITIIWLIAITTALIYIGVRQDTTTQNYSVPITYSFAANMLYCYFVSIILSLLPVMIIISSIIKTILVIRRKNSLDPPRRRVPLQDHVPKAFNSKVAEEIESFYGTLASSTVFIITSLPWTCFVLLKTLRLNGNASVNVELALLSVSVSGIGVKTLAYILGCGFLRRSLFSNLLKNSSAQFTLEQPASVITNIAVM
eukprot:gene13862-15310_t